MRLTPLALLITLLTIIACGGGGDNGNSSGGGSPLIEMLGAIPDTPGTSSYISYANLDAYYDALGVGSPPGGASNDEFNDWLGELSDAERGDVAPLIGSSEFAMDALRDTEAYQNEIGLDPADIDQAIEAGPPPETVHVLRGEFDDGEIEDAVANDPGFSDILERSSYGDVSFYSWGEDFEQDFERNSPVHTLGRGGRLAVSGDLLYWCFGTEGMTGMIDASTDASTSLADRADFRAMAEMFASRGAYSVRMFSNLDDDTDVGPLAAFAAGSGMDGNEPVLTALFAYQDAQTATENLALVESVFNGIDEYWGRPWSDQVEVIDFETDGSLVVATFHGPALPWDIWDRGEILLTSGG